MAESAVPFDRDYELADRYRVREGRVFLTGNQALVRLPLMQRERDEAAGLRTAGFISGYRGSPLGTYDMNLWQAKDFLEAHAVRFEPGLNEDLAATAVWGSQQAHLMEGATKQGVFGIWYGKGPGVDRSCDALKHGNYMGSAEYGGVLVLMGDDPGAKSSSIAHQSEPALIHCGIPVLNPSNVQEYLDLGLHGIALSRFSGCWVGFKCLTDTVESSASVQVSPDRVQPVLPEDAPDWPGGVHIKWENMPLQVEKRLEVKLARARAYVRANRLDRAVLEAPRKRIGIVTTGKAYLDVRQALEELGVDATRAADMGLSIYKVAMPWPLEPEGALEFAAGHEELFVVEEKKAIIEEQLAHLLYNQSERPRIVGKRDEAGRALLPSTGELTPGLLVEALGAWLERRIESFVLPTPSNVVSLPVVGQGGGLMRLPSFCSGCPHNRSTVVPEGSVALGGIGCHGMAVWLPERRTLAVTQMGAEGVNWMGIAPFSETKHIFQNMGDGTYFHSGLLAIRASVAAGVNITYKILLNGAVAMTGGQPIEGEVMAGEITTPEVVRQLLAEGVARVDVVTNEPAKYRPGTIPQNVRVHHRDGLDALQKQLRETPGVTAIVYDQTCAAEARRLRKRGEFPDPEARVVINERVCEGCGDCSVQSNCIAIEPVETRYGRKRRINQSSCNKDYSCLLGYCPSFVTVTGGRVRKRGGGAAAEDDEAIFAGLPAPVVADCERPFNVFVAGIGGTGVITVGALLGMAAHLEGKGTSLLDVTGLAQKNGPVSSHVRISARAEDLFATRIAAGAADLVLGCDIVVTTSPDGLARMSPERTTAVVNRDVAPTADFATNADLDLSSKAMEDAVSRVCKRDGLHALAASSTATALFGDAIAANLFMLGYAMQLGRVPVGLEALERAIELNGRAVEMNKRALRWGRLAAHDAEAVRAFVAGRGAGGADASADETLESIVADRSRELVAWQNERYAQRYRAMVDEVAAAERRLFDDTPLAEAVARYAFKVMAYKDEFEVARLYTDGSFERQIAEEFEGDYEVHLHLAPQMGARDPQTGRPRKLKLGSWMLKLLAVMAKLRFLRGTLLDPTRLMAHRRLERRMVDEYEALTGTLAAGLGPDSREIAIELASLPEHVRGFDDIKERNLEAARTKQAELLEAFERVAPGR
jgi:indolepyruvate ferredoxin oxidoreductase